MVSLGNYKMMCSHVKTLAIGVACPPSPAKLSSPQRFLNNVNMPLNNVEYVILGDLHLSPSNYESSLGYSLLLNT